MLEFGFKSDVGKRREKNQDSFFVMPDVGIFLIADGVGGHRSGEIASRVAMMDFARYVKENPIAEDARQDELRKYFSRIFKDINRHIRELACDDSKRGMATTLVMLYIKDNHAFVINVGDSRLYLIREGKISQITEDHSFVNDLVKKGIISAEQARNHPDRNMITRAMGAEEEVQPDYYVFDIYSDDIILMCTDGLYGEVDDENICHIVLDSDSPRDACARLVKAANDNRGNDNITVVSVRI